MRIDVIETPRLLAEGSLLGRLCVVIDVLRATTTAVVVLATGAVEIIPCSDREEALREKSRCKRPSLLGGEEMGRPIPGFDLGNSPLEYLAREKIAGKAVFFSTTNGTVAIRRAYGASRRRVYLGALLNLSAVSSQVAKEAPPQGVALLCSGRKGGLSAEDLLCAGLLVNKIDEALRLKGEATELGDGALIASGFARANAGKELEVLSSSEHGRYLQSIGFAADIEFASHLDAYDVVPVFDRDRIVTAR